MKSTRVGKNSYFYPRSPCGERHPASAFGNDCKFISIHALLAESDRLFIFVQSKGNISIHALLAESDLAIQGAFGTVAEISIHALLAESDNFAVRVDPRRNNFYPRSPCGERPGLPACRQISEVISIHALLAESDSGRASAANLSDRFLSTLSLRRATV